MDPYAAKLAAMAEVKHHRAICLLSLSAVLFAVGKLSNSTLSLVMKGAAFTMLLPAIGYQLGAMTDKENLDILLAPTKILP